MGKLFGIVLIVLGIWVGLEIYTEGTDRAFGGLLASPGAPASTDAAPEAPLDQVRGKLDRAQQLQRDRLPD